MLVELHTKIYLLQVVSLYWKEGTSKDKIEEIKKVNI